MTRVAIVLANGQGKRWDGPTHKCLVDIEGTPLLERTVAQLQARGWHTIVASHRLELDLGDEFARMPVTGSPVETALHAAPRMRGDRNAVLLGDVCWSEAAQDMLATCEGTRLLGRLRCSPLVGSPAENFGFVFDSNELHRVLNAFRASAGASGTTWQAYRDLIGEPVTSQAVESEVYLNISDWTDDFDTLQRYETWTRIYACRWIGGGLRVRPTAPREQPGDGNGTAKETHQPRGGSRDRRRESRIQVHPGRGQA